MIQEKNMEAARVIQNPLVSVNEAEDKLVKLTLSVEVK